jgi:LPPG:FO 2-phospho-L-lactate transferase
MADEPVRTHVRAGGRWWPFQEFMIVSGAEGPVEGVEMRGVDAARPSPEVERALASAAAVIVGPSNPVVSIGPILAVPGMREAIRAAPGPVVAISPFVEGRAIKGPTDLFCEYAGLPLSAEGVARAYEGLVDGLVADEPAVGLPVLQADTLMDGPEARRRVASLTLDFARSLAG